MEYRRLRVIALSAVTLLFLAFVEGAPVHAGCTEPKEAGTLKQSIRRAARCNNKILRSGIDATCAQTPPPTCAGTLAADAVALGYGPNNPPASGVDRRALRDQLKCQKRIGRAVSHYTGTRLRYRTRGWTPEDAEAKALRQLDKIPEYCAVTVAQDASGVVLPAVGPQCAAAVGDPGDPVNATQLRDCLRTLLGVWVERNGPDPQPLRPNIVFILTDDQRWDTTDATHSPFGTDVMPRTRAELAASGVEFTNAFMTTPLCCPSRASILSGQYAHHTGVYSNGGVNGGADDFDDSFNMGTLMQSAGYRTGFYGKYLNGYNALWTAPDPPYVPPGWDEWHAFKSAKFYDYTLIENGVEVSYGSAETDYSTDVLREKAKQFISDSVALGEPFFLYLAFKAPHLPQQPAPRHIGMFAGTAQWRPPSYNEPDVSDKPTWVQNTPPLDAQEQADLDQVRISQLEMLQAVDEAIGGSTTYGSTGIMEILRNLGVADDTVVIYFSDNGWYWGEHRFRAKNKPYEEAIRSPMFVRYPKLAPLPRTESQFALNIDLCPTLAELALRPTDPPVPVTFDGASLVRLIDGTAVNWRTDFLTEGWPNGHEWATVREARMLEGSEWHEWKYTELPITPGDPNTAFEYELYDLVSDPYELTNVAGDPANAARMTAMAARLRALRPSWPLDSDGDVELPDED